MNRGGASSSSGRDQAEQTGAAEAGRYGVINYDEPESCPFLNHALTAAHSGSSQEQLHVLSNLAFALPDPLQVLAHKDYAVGAAVYLLEKGLLPVVVAGLEAAGRGVWLELLEERVSGRPTDLINKAAVCTWVLKRLVHDTRTIKFILHHAPGVLGSLQKMYQLETGMFPENVSSPGRKWIHNDTGLKILGVLTLILVWSEQARRKLAKSDAFLTCLLKRVLANASQEDYVVRALAVFVHTPPFALTETFGKIAADCLSVVTRLLTRSTSRHEIEYAIKILARVGATQFATFRSQFLADPVLVDSAKALVISPNANKHAHALSRAIVWAHLQAKAGVTIEEEEYSRILAGGLSEQQESQLQTEALQSATALKRSCALVRIYAQQANVICLGHVFPPLHESEASSVACVGSPCGDFVPPEPVRQCSKTGCKSFERRSRQFKMCSQCKLTAYCSKECQKEAWKAGHKDLCNKYAPIGNM